MKKIIILTIISSLCCTSNAAIKELFELGKPQKAAPHSVRPRFGAKPATAAQTVTTQHEEIKAQTVAQPSEQTGRMITISNGITRDMITYTKHWSGHHVPARFSVTVNGQTLTHTGGRKKAATTEPLSISLADAHAELTYSFDFVAMGVSYRKGEKTLRLSIPAETDSLIARFSWDDQERLIIEDAKTHKRLATELVTA